MTYQELYPKAFDARELTMKAAIHYQSKARLLYMQGLSTREFARLAMINLFDLIDGE